MEKRVIKVRHNHFTQVRNAAIVFTTEESFGLIEFKANKLISNAVPLSGIPCTRIRVRAVERISDD